MSKNDPHAISVFAGLRPTLRTPHAHRRCGAMPRSVGKLQELKYRFERGDTPSLSSGSVAARAAAERMFTGGYFMMGVASIARRIAAVASVVAATTAAVSAEESRLDVVLKRDKLIVGSYSTSPPMAFVDKDGKLTGFEIELARLIAKSLLGDPNKIEFVTVTAEGRFPAVLSGKVDFGIAATTIYPERAVRVAFTEPYMDSASALIVRKDSNVRSLADVNNENMTVAALNTPVARDSATQYFPKAKLSNFETPSALFLALKSGRVQGVYADKPILDYYALQNDEFRVLPELLTEVMGNAIFVKPGDFQWWLFLDTTIKEYRYNSRYADYRDLYRRWFGKDPAPQRFYLPERTAK